MALLVLLGAIGLGPGGSGSLGPVPTPPRFDAAVGVSQPLSSRRAGVLAARVVAGGSRQARVGRRPAAAPQDGGSKLGLAVAPAQTVATANVPSAPLTPAPAAPAEPEVGGDGGDVPATGSPLPVASTEAPSAPVAKPPSGAGGGPVAAGGGLESCDGGEYVITVVLAPEAGGDGEGEEASVEIILRRYDEDGSVDELRLEGDQLDARSVALQLSAEGNCVAIEVTAPDEDEGAASSTPVPDLEAPAQPEAP